MTARNRSNDATAPQNTEDSPASQEDTTVTPATTDPATVTVDGPADAPETTDAPETPAETDASTDDRKTARPLDEVLTEANEVAYKYAIQANANFTAVGHHLARMTGALTKSFQAQGNTVAQARVLVNGVPAVRVLAGYLALQHGIGTAATNISADDVKAVVAASTTAAPGLLEMLGMTASK